MSSWVIVTGGGTGIGRGLVHHFCGKGHNVLTCGRRAQQLQETRCGAPKPANVVVVACDIGTAEGRAALFGALPSGAPVELLVQNAAIGDPAPAASIDVADFEHALRVNVVAPLALTQLFLPSLQAGSGRILHIGTSVAFNPQVGTATYGITKIAFHRLYQQLNKEDLGGVAVGSLSPGMVDTEGVQDHVAKARALDLPHVRYFDEAFARGWTTPMPDLARFVDELLAMDAASFASKEWRFSEWRRRVDDALTAPKEASASPLVGMAALSTGLLAIGGWWWLRCRRSRL